MSGPENREAAEYAAAAPDLERAAKGTKHEFHPHDLMCIHCGADLDDFTCDADCPERAR